MVALAVLGPASAAARDKSAALRIVLLADTKGEASQALPYSDDGAKLAARQLGVDNVEYIRISTAQPPASADSALRQALARHPDAIIGLTAASQVLPLTATIERAGVPFFALTSDDALLLGGRAGARNLYSVRPLGRDTAAALADYVTKTLKARRIGLVCVGDTNGSSSCDEVRGPLAEAGATVVALPTSSASATDLADVAVAMKDVDAVLDFDAAASVGELANVLAANGVSAPHIATDGAGTAADSKEVTGAALANLRGVEDCAPRVDKASQAKSFAKAYQTAYGYPPQYAAAETYDLVRMLYEAGQRAGSTDPARLMAAVDQTTYKGACGTYHPDSGNVMLHAATLVRWDANGLEQQVKVFALAPSGPARTTTTTTTTSP